MTGTIRTNCVAYTCHPNELDEAMMESKNEQEWEEFVDKHERHLFSGVSITCADPDEPGDYVQVTDRLGEAMWVEGRFIQWEGQR